jgi:hypothetical protein
MDMAAASVENEWQPLDEAIQGDTPCLDVISHPPVEAMVTLNVRMPSRLLTSHFQLVGMSSPVTGSFSGSAFIFFDTFIFELLAAKAVRGSLLNVQNPRRLK